MLRMNARESCLIKFYERTLKQPNIILPEAEI